MLNCVVMCACMLTKMIMQFYLQIIMEAGLITVPHQVRAKACTKYENGPSSVNHVIHPTINFIVEPTLIEIELISNISHIEKLFALSCSLFQLVSFTIKVSLLAKDWIWARTAIFSHGILRNHEIWKPVMHAHIFTVTSSYAWAWMLKIMLEIPLQQEFYKKIFLESPDTLRISR